MNLGKFGRGVAAMTIVVALAAACTPDPGPTPSPTPAGPTTPAETELERQERVAYEAAEKSYRTFRTEYNRVLEAGGSKSPTKVMTETAGGDYLKEVMTVARAFKGFGDRQIGDETIAYVRGAGFEPDSVLLEVCEDSRKVKAVDKKGKSLGPGELRTIQIDVRLKDNRWKLWSGDGKKVDSCE